MRKQQAVACLAFSCDWLSHKVLKVCVAIKHQSSTDDPSSGLEEKLGSPSRTVDAERRMSSTPGSATAPAQKLRLIGRKLSQLADDSLLCLRLEVRKCRFFLVEGSTIGGTSCRRECGKIQDLVSQLDAWGIWWLNFAVPSLPRIVSRCTCW